MAGRLLWRGMLAGLVAAFVAALFAFLFAEPLIDRAIAFEATEHAMKGMAEGPELVSRDMQKTAGLLTAMLVYGTGIGGLFALTFAYAYGRAGAIGPRTLAITLAALAFVIIALVPAIKYPPNPPAVGNHETIRLRTGAYFAMILISFVSAQVALVARRALLGRIGSVDASLLAALVFAMLVAIVGHLLPAIDEVPATFGASLLWNYRLAALGTQLVFWVGLGWLFGWLATRLLAASNLRDRS